MSDNTTSTPNTHAEVAKAIVADMLRIYGAEIFLPKEKDVLLERIAAAIRDEYERGLTIGFDRGQGWAKTREGAMDRAGLVFDGEDKIVTRHGTILDSAGNVRRGAWMYADTPTAKAKMVFVPVDQADAIKTYAAQGAKHE